MNASESSEETDWRLVADLQVDEPHRRLGGLLHRLRGDDLVHEVKEGVPEHVVITHDGSRLFAYAPDEPTIKAARAAIENILRGEDTEAEIAIGHWDEEGDRWRQVDPPLTAEQVQGEQAAERDAEAVETRTLIISSGKMIRAEFEQSMREWAEQLELECQVIEHPHLLTTQLAFTVTGPKGKIDEFEQGLKAEGNATFRAEREVMISPL